VKISTRTARALSAAGIEDPIALSDDDLLAVDGIGARGLAEIRASIASPPSTSGGHSSPSDVEGPTSGAAEPSATDGRDATDRDPAALGPASPSEPACTSPSPSGARCWQVTHARYVGGKRERYCGNCGAIEGAETLGDRGIKER
jgi:hypothetical protein